LIFDASVFFPQFLTQHWVGLLHSGFPNLSQDNVVALTIAYIVWYGNNIPLFLLLATTALNPLRAALTGVSTVSFSAAACAATCATTCTFLGTGFKVFIGLGHSATIRFLEQRFIAVALHATASAGGAKDINFISALV
jgi:hypothetical protein